MDQRLDQGWGRGRGRPHWGVSHTQQSPLCTVLHIAPDPLQCKIAQTDVHWKAAWWKTPNYVLVHPPCVCNIISDCTLLNTTMTLKTPPDNALFSQCIVLHCNALQAPWVGGIGGHVWTAALWWQRNYNWGERRASTASFASLSISSSTTISTAYEQHGLVTMQLQGL